MRTTQLIRELEKEEYILPKDILKKISEDELIKQIEEIYVKHQDVLQEQEKLRYKYTELVSYLFFLNIQRAKSKKKSKLFSDKLINYLLSTPEGV